MAPNTILASTTYKTVLNGLFSFVTTKSKWFIASFWILLIATYWLSTHQIAPTAVEKVKLLCEIVKVDRWGPILFVVAYVLQPLVFFPTFLMTIAAGILYGPVWGMFYTFVGANLAASLSYGVGYLLGAETLGHLVTHPRIERYVNRLRTNTFETILILGLLHAPFDILNYLSGILRLHWRQFTVATAIGLIPGGLPFVLFGSSLGTLEDLTTGRPDLNLPLLGLSIAIAAVAIVASSYLRKRIEE